MFWRITSRLYRLLRWLALALALLWLADGLFPLPLPQDDAARVVLAEDSTPLWRFADKDGVWRYPINPQQVSPYYLEALLTYEDRWFYQHPGVNPLALLRATWQNLAGGRVLSGGSTLSMQVARLLDPHSRTLSGKLKQLWRTAQLEWHLSKDEILTLYLNRAPFGGTLQGVAAASWAYLGKPPSQLTRSEAALLAVLPQAPSRLRPDRHPKRAQAARDKVLERLAQFAVWPKQAVLEAKQEQVLLAPRKEPRLAPLLARRLYQSSHQPLIESLIDAPLQQRLEDLLQGWKARLPQASSAAVLVVESETMAVRAYLGSLDFDDAKRFGHVDMIRAQRSPGSTLKPFLYALAMDEGLVHSESLLQDVPRHFGDYRPGNFASGFAGPVSVSEALVSSLNLPAVQLLEAYGPKRFAGELRSAGLKIALPSGVQPNLALILGGGGARLEQLVSAYSAFARGGRTAKLRLQADDALSERRLLSAESAWIIRRILSGQSKPQLNPRAELVQRQPLAWKTGTSYGFRDAWAIGISERYLIGIWLGRPDGTPVPGQYGVASAVPLLLQVHDILSNRDRAKHLPSAPDVTPSGIGVAAICWPLGQKMAKSDPNCRRQRFAWTLQGTVPPTLQAADQPLGLGLSRTLWVNAEGRQVGAHCPGAIRQSMAFWPAALEPWLPRREWREYRLPAVDKNCPPSITALPEPLSISGVRSGERLRRPAGSSEPLNLQFSVIGGSGQYWWFLNGAPLAESRATEAVSKTFAETGHYQLTLLDSSGQTAQVTFVISD